MRPSAPYRVLSPVQRARRRYLPGETLSLTEEDAAALLAGGVIEAAPDRSPEPPADAGDRRAVAGDGARMATRVAAIRALPPDAPRTKSGAPTVAALEAALGHDLTSAERDAAWAAYNDARREET